MNKQKIVLAGGKGFLGQYLHKYFQSRGYDIVVLTRNPKKINEIHWDAESTAYWVKQLEGAYALINLTGHSVDCRYNYKNKYLILSSRIFSTRVLGEAISNCKTPPKFWLNSSTATIYENTPGDLPANTEKDGKIGDDFSMKIAKAWEMEFFSHKTPNTIKTALRTAIVYGKEGGAFPVLTKLAKRGLCSPQGNGKQWISWVHEFDFARAIEFVMQNKMHGVVNICSPHFIQNKDFNLLLKKAVKPKFCLPQPKWLLEVGAFLLQTETELILKSRKVFPERLIRSGFEFQLPDSETAIDQLLY